MVNPKSFTCLILYLCTASIQTSWFYMWFLSCLNFWCYLSPFLLTGVLIHHIFVAMFGAASARTSVDSLLIDAFNLWRSSPYLAQSLRGGQGREQVFWSCHRKLYPISKDLEERVNQPVSFNPLYIGNFYSISKLVEDQSKPKPQEGTERRQLHVLKLTMIVRSIFSYTLSLL